MKTAELVEAKARAEVYDYERAYRARLIEQRKQQAAPSYPAHALCPYSCSEEGRCLNDPCRYKL